MKAAKTSLLLYGHDTRLLETRKWVLQSRGYGVITFRLPSGINSVPRSTPIQLLILCHSLSPEECAVAEALALRRWPTAQVLTLVPETSRSPTGILNQLMHTMDGPAKLIALVQGLVGSSPPEPVVAPAVEHAAPHA